MEKQEIDIMFDKAAEELKEYGLNVIDGFYSTSFRILKEYYAHCQQQRISPSIKVREMAVKSFLECQRWGKENFITVTIDAIQVDRERLKRFTKKHSFIN